MCLVSEARRSDRVSRMSVGQDPLPRSRRSATAGETTFTYDACPFANALSGPLASTHRCTHRPISPSTVATVSFVNSATT